MRLVSGEEVCALGGIVMDWERVHFTSIFWFHFAEHAELVVFV